MEHHRAGRPVHVISENFTPTAAFYVHRLPPSWDRLRSSDPLPRSVARSFQSQAQRPQPVVRRSRPQARVFRPVAHPLPLTTCMPTAFPVRRMLPARWKHRTASTDQVPEFRTEIMLSLLFPPLPQLPRCARQQTASRISLANVVGRAPALAAAGASGFFSTGFAGADFGAAATELAGCVGRGAVGFDGVAAGFAGACPRKLCPAPPQFWLVGKRYGRALRCFWFLRRGRFRFFALLQVVQKFPRVLVAFRRDRLPVPSRIRSLRRGCHLGTDVNHGATGVLSRMLCRKDSTSSRSNAFRSVTIS